ncbi:cysA [Symbiodinium pilosum]|uniref:CysA protein n=1 Tax=Symbiodinium pilosum TaxID=2952 RepID=A0A812P7V4_SYMPI|nr:cysA [Symbiodinium pilosum]
MLLCGGSALLCFGFDYILLALTLLGASVAAGIVDGNTPAMLADRSQEKYGGTGQVFVLSNVADQAAFILGPIVGSSVCQQVSTFSGRDDEPQKSANHSNTKHLWKELGVATRCLQHRGEVADGIGCVGIPIHLSQAFIYEKPGTPYPRGAIYGRFDHPTRQKLEQCHSSCEMSAHALAFSTYEAAVASIMAMLKSGDRMLVLGLRHDESLLRFFKQLATRRAFQLQDIVCPTGLSSADRADMLSGAKMCWLDGARHDKTEIMAWGRACRKTSVHLLVDGSACPPTSQLLMEGASIAIYPCNTFIAARADIRTCMLSTTDPAVFKSVNYFRQTLGSTPGNFDCYLAFRGFMSLKARLDRQAATTTYLVGQLRMSETLRVESVAQTSFQLRILGAASDQAATVLDGLSRLSLVCSQEPRSSLKFAFCPNSSPEQPLNSTSNLPWSAVRTHAWAVPGELHSGPLVQVQIGLESPGDLLREILSAFSSRPDCGPEEHQSPEGFTSRMMKAACDPSDPDAKSACPQYPLNELSILERMMAEAHNANFAVAFASGSATYHALLDQLSPGDHVIASNRLYVGAFEAFQDIAAEAYDVTFTFVDLDDWVGVAAAILPETRLLWVESASNPLGHPADIPRLARLCREHRAQHPEQLLHLVVDNTWCGPCMLQPLMQGADLVVESLTKTIGGHSDLMIGAVCTNVVQMHDELLETRGRLGNGPARLDCDLAVSALDCPEARMDVMVANARRLAAALDAHPKISKVHASEFHSTTGTKGCPTNMIAFYVDGKKDDVVRFLRNLRLIKLVGSFGDSWLPLLAGPTRCLPGQVQI